MVIRNDRPTTPKPTPSSTPTPTPTPATTGPADLSGTSGVDDDLDAAGVTDIEKLAGQSLADGMSLGAPSAASRPSTPSTLQATALTSARTNEPGAVTALIEGVVDKLKPGEKVTVGAKGEVGELFVAEGGVELEITKRDDGAFDVKVTREGQVGVGAEVGLGTDHGVKAKAEAKGTFGAGNEVTFKAATLDEAVKLSAEVVAGAVAGAALIPGIGSELGVTGVVWLNEASVRSTKWALSGELALDLEGELDPTMKLALSTTNAQSLGIVFESPDSYFLELEVEGTAEAGAVLGDDALEAVAGGGAFEGKATLKVPLKGIDPAKLGTESGRAALLVQVKENLSRSTLSVEGKLAATTAMGDVPVTVTRTVKASDAATLFTTGGWDAVASIDVGPKIGGTIGVAEAEIVAQRSIILYEHKGGTLADEVTAVASKKDELVRLAEKQDPSRLKRPALNGR